MFCHISLEILPHKHMKTSNISGLFWSSFSFFRKEPYSLIHEITVICKHWAGSMQSVSQFQSLAVHFNSSGFFVRVIWWGGLNKMTLHVFLVRHFLKSNCSNCQRDDLLFLPRRKVIHWQLLLEQDSQSLLMHWKIMFTTWARQVQLFCC